MKKTSKVIRTQSQRSQNREHSVPIYMTSSYVFDSAEQARSLFANEENGPIYSRYSNPNTDEFIEKLCVLEGAEDGVAVASGMAAMFSSLASFLKSSDHIVVSRSVFGSTHQIVTKILPGWGIQYTYVDGTDNNAWVRAIRPYTKMFFCETPSNPALDVLDLPFLGNLAKEKNIILNVDNCFATPILQTPLTFGAGLVTHSATKFIDGQGRSLGGAILGNSELIEQVRFFTRHTGPAMSPFNGWLLSKSLETLSLRMERHSETALWIAQSLDDHPTLSKIHYPFLSNDPGYTRAKKQMNGGGGILSFVHRNGLEGGRNFLDRLEMISRTANLGDSRSTATHPASTTHSKLSLDERLEVGITDGLIRISVGLEDKEDILSDILQALETK
ncbi:MAG: aminotransferase class I/II-fold pyridoxal phosphate-dependent enzyme [Spirochaetales bacterium]|nr:aminotransferase class I/II-fold pyridoxal phosphate-dependent enzyme [Spirochaetales bacterium]